MHTIIKSRFIMKSDYSFLLYIYDYYLLRQSISNEIGVGMLK